MTVDAQFQIAGIDSRSMLRSDIFPNAVPLPRILRFLDQCRPLLNTVEPLPSVSLCAGCVRVCRQQRHWSQGVSGLRLIEDRAGFSVVIINADLRRSVDPGPWGVYRDLFRRSLIVDHRGCSELVSTTGAEAPIIYPVSALFVPFS